MLHHTRSGFFFEKEIDNRIYIQINEYIYIFKKQSQCAVYKNYCLQDLEKKHRG